MAFKELELNKVFRIAGESQEFIKVSDYLAQYKNGPYKGAELEICGDTKIKKVT